MLAHSLSVKTILFYASIIGLFSLDNKKNCSFFFEEMVVIACVCAVFVVSLCPNFKINNPANGSQDERSPGKEKARK
jgi:hypothetical protein